MGMSMHSLIELSNHIKSNVYSVFQCGTIVESGTHQELIAQGGIYEKMC
jgi:ABC-type multidrug transport system fused ATPase/permease subunit